VSSLNDVLVSLLVLVISALLVEGLVILFRLFTTWRGKVEAHLGTELMGQLDYVVQTAVRAAEQNGLAGKIEQQAEVLFNYALTFAQNYLDKLGVGDIVDVDILAGLIEAKVREGVHKRLSEAYVSGGFVELDSDEVAALQEPQPAH